MSYGIFHADISKFSQDFVLAAAQREPELKYLVFWYGLIA